MKEKPISLAIVGHTNTGKTSLIRTLTRNNHFGAVKDAAGTTRHVEMANLLADNQVIIQLFDTPGLEDSSALLEEIDRLSTNAATPLKQNRLACTLEHEKELEDFEQEIKVIRQALNSDILLYVIDVREPLIEKYVHEIEILGMAAKPIIPVFNFISDNEESLEQWRQTMASHHLHAYVEFDTVAFDFEAEKRLYQKTQSLMESRYEFIQKLIDYRMQLWSTIVEAATKQSAELIINIAAYRVTIPQKADIKSIQHNLQEQVRTAENKCLNTILSIFEFTDEDLEYSSLPVSNRQWERDLFEPETLKEFGLDAGSSALKGGAVGAGIDLMFAGLSLGTMSLTGAAIGAGWSTLKRYGRDLKATATRQQWQCIDDQTLSLIILRQLQLLNSLTNRGFASQEKLTEGKSSHIEIPKTWEKLIKRMRDNPDWSQLDEEIQNSSSRDLFLKELSLEIEHAL